MDAISQFVLEAAGSPVALLAVFVLTVIDGLLPALPSESVVIGLAAISSTTGQPLVFLGVTAAVAAFLGDNLSYEIGRAVGLDRFRWMRNRSFTRAMDRAAAALGRRVSTAVLAGRFVPGARVGVSLVAGATGVPRRVYRPLTMLSASLWSVYMLILGTIGGAWVSANPLLGIVATTALGVVIGLAVDRVLTLVRGGAARPAAARAAGAANAPAETVSRSALPPIPAPATDETPRV
ncbi:DedA family protein [Georgenia halophila]|uniref:DedA family protein n=1 Tax=Georgenia halophila TaxID=620889 RepID=UPI0031E81D49